jgi:hypothetical protein
MNDLMDGINSLTLRNNGFILSFSSFTTLPEFPKKKKERSYKANSSFYKDLILYSVT